MTFHPSVDMLAAYAAGAVEEGEALVVATHLALCPTCRQGVERLEAVGGALFEAGDVARSADDSALEAVLAQLDAPEPPRPPSPPPEPVGPDDLPLPLRRYTGPLARVPFRWAGPGVWRFDLPQSRPERPVALVSLRPGMRVPDHRHSAPERGVVLRGGFTDETGHYLRGDVTLRGPDEPDVHQQRIDDGERCVVLMVDDGPKVPTTWTGRMASFLFRL